MLTALTQGLIRSYQTKSLIGLSKIPPRRNIHLSSYGGLLAACRLKSRSLLQLSGPDTFQFLQGLVSNNITELEESKTPCVQYCMMLNVQGRVLYDLFLYNVTKSSEDKPTVFVEVDRAAKADLEKLFKKYKLRKKLMISDAGEQCRVWARFSNNQMDEKKSPDPPNSPIGDNNYTFEDPRLKALGHRILTFQDDSVSNEEIVEEREYRKFRYTLGVSEGVYDLPTANCLPLESNLDYMNGVNFHKGCYIGQELTARTHHTGVIRKRVVPLLLERAADVEADAAITTKEKGKSAGKFRGSVGVNGIGLVRLAHVGSQLCVTAKDGTVVSLTCHTPYWWPPSITSH